MGTHPIFESDFDCLTASHFKMIRYVSCSISKNFVRPLSFGPRQGQKLSNPSLIVQKRYNLGRSEAKLSKSTVCVILATMWGGLYAMYTHSENYKEEQKRIEREQAQWSNANNVDIGKGDWTLIDCKTEKVEKIMDIIDIHKAEQKKDSSLPDIQPVFIS